MPAKASPTLEMTMNAAVWRSANDDEFIASAINQHDHLGKVWISSITGEDPALSNRFPGRTIRTIKLRRSGTMSLPIMPTGAIPLPTDLVLTSTGYVVKPSEAHKYQLSQSTKRELLRFQLSQLISAERDFRPEADAQVHKVDLPPTT